MQPQQQGVRLASCERDREFRMKRGSTNGKQAKKTTRLKTNHFLWYKKGNSEGKAQAMKNKPKKKH